MKESDSASASPEAESGAVASHARRAAPGGWKQIARAAFAIAAFFGGLAGTAGITAGMAGRTPVPEFTAKLADVAANRGEYEVLFLGSSRVRRQISPEVFDATAREAGVAVKSYNFGLDGLGFPEILYIADEILALKPPRLKHVFLELTRFSREFGPLAQPDSPRTIYWHTLPYTAMLCRAIWNDPAQPTIGQRSSVISEHVEIFLRRAANIGRGAELIGIAAKEARHSRKMGPAGDGFFPVNQQFPANRRAEYAKQIEDLKARLREPAAPEPIFAEATIELLEKFRKAGVTPILVTMPRIYPSTPWSPREKGQIVLEYHDPVANAELFDPRLHYDPQHLNAEGAKVFSRELAHRFAEIVRAQSGGAAP